MTDLASEPRGLDRLYAVLRRQPVRTYLYGLLGPGLAVAGAYGLVSQERAVLWLALGGAVLLPFGVEVARARVTPLVRPRNNDGDKLVPLLNGRSIRLTKLDDKGQPVGEPVHVPVTTVSFGMDDDPFVPDIPPPQPGPDRAEPA